MVQLKLKPYSEVFYGRSRDGGETAAFPGPGATSLLTHAAVAENLAAMPARQKSGAIWRGGDHDSFLGFLRLPTTWWTDVEPATIADDRGASGWSSDVPSTAALLGTAVLALCAYRVRRTLLRLLLRLGTSRGSSGRLRPPQGAKQAV